MSTENCFLKGGSIVVNSVDLAMWSIIFAAIIYIGGVMILWAFFKSAVRVIADEVIRVKKESRANDNKKTEG
jgi:hypothetical protein